MRKCTEKHFINKFLISKGDICASSWTGVCYNPKLYKDPMKFDPLRFDENKYNDPFLWPMFSSGPRYLFHILIFRNCIGQNMSLLEIKIMVILFVKNFEY